MGAEATAPFAFNISKLSLKVGWPTPVPYLDPSAVVESKWFGVLPASMVWLVPAALLLLGVGGVVFKTKAVRECVLPSKEGLE